MKYFPILFVFVFGAASGEECDELKDLGDGVPKQYHVEECRGNVALQSMDYDSASLHFEKALSIVFFEAPNYLLRLELSRTLCLGNQKIQGRKHLERFVLMAKADLGQINCPEDWDPKTYPEHFQLVCDGYGSGLNLKGKKMIQEKLEEAKAVARMCKNA